MTPVGANWRVERAALVLATLRATGLAGLLVFPEFRRAVEGFAAIGAFVLSTSAGSSPAAALCHEAS